MKPLVKQAVELAMKEDKAMLKRKSWWNLFTFALEMIASAVVVLFFAAIAGFLILMAKGAIEYALSK